MKKFFVLGALLVSSIGILVGYKSFSSYKQQASQVEYASETNKKFYQKMVKMKKNSTMIFDGFPSCLTSSITVPLGTEIMTTGTDTLHLVFRELNHEDINRYRFYLIGDNHQNLWSIFRHNEYFVLTRENENLIKVPKKEKAI